jgi:hypothetical protein
MMLVEHFNGKIVKYFMSGYISCNRKYFFLIHLCHHRLVCKTVYSLFHSFCHQQLFEFYFTYSSGTATRFQKLVAHKLIHLFKE